jgi:TRAP-type transport system periplasmic protein
MRFSHKSLATMSLAVLCSAAAISVPAAEVKLKAASFLPERAVFAKYFYRWVNSVNKDCAGDVKISVVGPAAIKSLEQWRALKDGVIDLHYGPPNYYKGAMVEGDITILANNSPAKQRANGAWAILNELHNKKLNAQYLTHLSDGVKFYLYTNKPAVNKRFDGFRLRSVPIYDGFFKTLGAQPLRMAPPALYTALERGAVDGYGWPLWGVGDFGWDKHTKYRHGPGFFSAVVNIIANLDKWKGLSDSQRQCLTDKSVWLESEFPNWRAAEDAAQNKVQDDAKIEYVDMGADFADKAHNLYWDIMTKANPEMTAKMKPLLLD